MANPNPPPNPDIAEIGKATHFGAGNDPVAAAKKAKPWSIRNQMRYLAAQEIDADDTAAFKLKGKVTRAQLLAMKTLQKASEGDVRAIELSLENIDGKLPQTNINAELERLKGMSEEELDAEQQRIDRELESLSRGAEDGNPCTEEGAVGTEEEAGVIQSPAAS